MVLNSIKVHFFVCAIFCMGCAENSHRVDNFLKLEKFAENPKAYDGKVVTLKGFLTSNSHDLILFRAPPDKSIRAGIVPIMDSSQEKMLSREGFRNLPTNCTKKHVKITGLVGFYELRKIWSIVDIEKIIIFDDADFISPGEVCYTKEEGLRVR